VSICATWCGRAHPRVGLSPSACSVSSDLMNNKKTSQILLSHSPRSLLPPKSCTQSTDFVINKVPTRGRFVNTSQQRGEEPPSISPRCLGPPLHFKLQIQNQFLGLFFSKTQSNIAWLDNHGECAACSPVCDTLRPTPPTSYFWCHFLFAYISQKWENLRKIKDNQKNDT
jgi:hypothetical protein